MAKKRGTKQTTQKRLKSLTMDWRLGGSSYFNGEEELSQAEFFKRLRAITKRARAEKSKAESSDDSS